MIQSPPLATWCHVQQCLERYRDNPTDRPLIQLIDGIVTALQTNPSCSVDATFGMSTYLLQQPRLADKISLKLNQEADRQIIEQRLCEWLNDNLIKFNPTGGSALYALVSWVNRSCSWWIHNLRKEHAIQRTGEISIDASIGDGQSSRLDTFDATNLAQSAIVPLSGLDRLIAAEQDQECQRQNLNFPSFQRYFQEVTDGLSTNPLVRSQQYILQDPTGQLKLKFYQDERCHYQYLATKLKLPLLTDEKPAELTEITTTFPSIKYSALYRHISDVFNPWMTGIFLDILNHDENQKFRELLESEHRDRLHHIHRKGTPQCTVLALAEHRLPCYCPTPTSWDELTTIFKAQGWKRATPDYIHKFWEETCREELGAIAIEILFYTQEL